jgi:hypothetical protein
MSSATDVPLDDRSAFLDRAVLISNSVPKSGSTFLHALQENFLLAVQGRPAARFDIFKDAGVKMSQAFVHRPHDPEFLDLIASPDLTGGPYVLKTHTPIKGRLREIFWDCDHVFVSMVVRDPVEVFLSARDNFRKTGEFPEFHSIDSGCALVSTYFADLFRSALASAAKKNLPIVRYEDVVSKPVETMLSSLHPRLQLAAMEAVARRFTNVTTASDRSSVRRNRAVLDRAGQHEVPAEIDELNRLLQDTRREFGY